ncbi:ABC transporter permease [Actinomadura sp. CNU-125]|uniref:ABC transporter permease n=1 Tax=Actinomadura sp. CNU-125 TaxID=1904961 RepID=UPI00291691CD|nr:ABC transporter permease subunit [Actinomadura sp. CNU-125]
MARRARARGARGGPAGRAARLGPAARHRVAGLGRAAPPDPVGRAHPARHHPVRRSAADEDVADLLRVLWPILINTLYALRDVDPVAKETLRSFGFGTPSVLWRVSLPSAAPFIVTGVRIAASVALVVVISTELFAGGWDGIGIYLSDTQSGGGRTDLLLAGAFWAGLLGLLANGLLLAIERIAFRWNTARVEGVS